MGFSLATEASPVERTYEVDASFTDVTLVEISNWTFNEVLGFPATGEFMLGSSFIRISDTDVSSDNQDSPLSAISIGDVVRLEKVDDGSWVEYEATTNATDAGNYWTWSIIGTPAHAQSVDWSGWFPSTYGAEFTLYVSAAAFRVPDVLDLYLTDRASTETHVYHIATGEETWAAPGYSVSVGGVSPELVYTIKSHTGWVSAEELRVRGRATTQIGDVYIDSQVYTLIGDVTQHTPPVTDVTEEGLSWLLEQFKRKDYIEALLSSYLDLVQVFDSNVYAVQLARDLDTADGDRLDGFGQILNVDRQGLTDDNYRVRLRAEMVILRSNGILEDVITSLQLLLNLSVTDIEAIEYSPKSIYLRPIDYAMGYDPDVVFAALRRAISAATRLNFVYSYHNDANTFTLSSQGAATESSALLGLGDAITGGGPYLFDIRTGTGGGFGAGELRFNAVDLGEATICRVTDTDGDAVDQTTFLDGLNGDVVHVLSDDGNGIIFTCAGTTDIGGYHELDMSNILVVGDPLADTDALTISATTTGGGHLSGVKGN